MTRTLPIPRSTREIGPAVLLVLAAVFLLSHPFTGIRHDGILYAGDALARLKPGQFHDDLYFLFGSQGRFTLLPAFYAGLIALFGFGGGTIAGMLFAFLLYLAATLYLVSWLVPASMRSVCALAVLLGWTVYGGNRVFGYSESFLTARSFAEPAVLFALGLMVRHRLVGAALMLAVALLIHPLIASCGLLIFWIFLVRGNARWLWIAPLAVLALVVLGNSGSGLFADVFTHYDESWLALVQEANGHAFVSRWTPNDYGVVVFDAVCLLFAYRFAERSDHRRFIMAVALAGLGATLASAILVDFALNPFFGKLQIWRALWVMQWVAIAGLAPVLLALWQRDDQGKLNACFLLLGWMATFSIVAAPAALLAAALELFRKRVTVSRTTTRIVVAVTIIAACTIFLQAEARVIKLGWLLSQPFMEIVAQLLTMNLLLMAIGISFVLQQSRLGRLAPMLAVLLFASALFFWDQRAAWTRSLESQPVDAHIWPGLIEPDAKVYWYRDMIAPWVLLGHANYYTQQQGSGAVFSRDMIIELEKRRKISALLDMQEQICRVMNNLNENATSCEPDAAATESICIEGGVDYVVLQSTLEGKKPVSSYSTGIVENGFEKKFYLYRCSALKQG